jgi:hypothetical protein
MRTPTTVLVPHLDEAIQDRVAVGAEIVQERWDSRRAPASGCATPTGCWWSTSSTGPVLTTSISPVPTSADRATEYRRRPPVRG